MRRWLSKDSTKLKLGVSGLFVFAAIAGIAGMSGGAQEASLQRSSTVANAPAEQADLQEKQKIAVTKTEVVTSEEEVPFETTNTYDGTLFKDTTVVRVEGRPGKKNIRTEVKTKDGQEISRSLISEEITVPPVAQVVAVGTKVMPQKKAEKTPGDCDPQYIPCVRHAAGDLDCGDIGHRVRIVNIGEDSHGFDRDNDGSGCESYPDPIEYDQRNE